MNKSLGQTSIANNSSQNSIKHELAIKKILGFFYILIASFILTSCSNPNLIEFRLNSEEVIFYQLSDFEIELDRSDDILDLVNQINYYSENVIELNNDEKKFLFFSYVSDLSLNMRPTQIYVSSFQDGDITIYEIYYYDGSFDSYRREYNDGQEYITCSVENVCRESSSEERIDFQYSDTSERNSLSTARVTTIAIGHLIYYADSPYHDVMSRVALAQNYLISPGFRRVFAGIDEVNANSLYEEDFTLFWFREYCSPSLSNCQRIVNQRPQYEIDLKNKTIIFDDDDYNPNSFSFGLIDENFNDYFNIYNENFIEDAYVVNGVFSNEKFKALKGDFSGNKGLENLRNYIFHDEQE